MIYTQTQLVQALMTHDCLHEHPAKPCAIKQGHCQHCLTLRLDEYDAGRHAHLTRVEHDNAALLLEISGAMNSLESDSRTERQTRWEHLQQLFERTHPGDDIQKKLDAHEHTLATVRTLQTIQTQEISRLEQWVGSLREALRPLATLAQTVHASRTKDFWFWKRSSSIEARVFGIHADDALRAENALHPSRNNTHDHQPSLHHTSPEHS